MKKLFAYLVAALFCTSLSAQQLDESFEGEQFPPEGWETITNYASAAWKKATKGGQVCAYVPGTYGTENWLITPQLKPAAGEKLSFSARIGDYAKNGQLRVEVSLSGTTADSFETLETFYTSQSAGDEAHRLWKSDWKTYTVDLSAYKGQAINIGFHQVGDADGIYLDDVKGVSLFGNASCDVPTNIVVKDITEDGAVVSWQGEADQYQYTVVENGEAADWSDAHIVSTKEVTIADLDPDTKYDFYVRAVCGAEFSLTPKVVFKTPCEAEQIPWLETFSRDATGDVQPECWTVASANPSVWVVADKTYDSEGNASTVSGQAHLYAYGGGPNTEQVFSLPVFNAPLNTLEVAFDYRTNMVSTSYGVLEVGYMTNPSKASSFVSLVTLPQTLTYVHQIVTLDDLPASAKYIAFRFAGGTSDYSGVSMDNFVVAEIGHSQETKPEDEVLPDAAIYGLTYCEAQFTWYDYSADAFAIGLFDAEAQALIAGIAVTSGECDRFAYQDGVGFSEDDYENKFYCSTRWILNVDEEAMTRGDSWNKCVRNVGGYGSTTLLGLQPGKYQVQIYKLNSTTYERGEKLSTINFELTEKIVTDLKAVVADDKKTATLTWEQPTLSRGERLYARIWAGETVAFDNFDDAKQVAQSPFTVDVVEGKSYTAIIQVLDKNGNALGAEVVCEFTVGVNNYEPTNPHAEIFGGDNVTFTWEAEAEADVYELVLYWNGEFYATLNVHGLTKTTTLPKDGTWSWTVQPFNVGSNGNYFPASNPVAGNDFESKAAEVPDDAIVYDIWAFEAAYIDEKSEFYQEGKYGWYLQFATGEEGNTIPAVYMLIYTNKEFAISGVYNVARANIDLESCAIDITGKQSDAIWATDAEIRLQFDGYDEEKQESGYYYGYYTGSFRLVGEDGKTYVGKFMELFCNSYDYSSASSGILSYKGMWEEDPSALIQDSVEEVLEEHGFDLSQPMYNIMGQQVDATYKGIVIQNGKKFMLQ